MSETTTLTIRLDEELKQRLERVATAEDRSLTEYVIRSIKERMDTQCPACGRSSATSVQPAGLSPAFDAWLNECHVRPNLAPHSVTTMQGSRAVVYWVHHRFGYPREGMLFVETHLGPLAQRGNPIVIPRGTITGWCNDPEGREYARLCAIGYIDGNHAVAQAYGATR